MRLARQQTGGGAGEEITLSILEERIVTLMGGAEFAVGDRNLEINPFHVCFLLFMTVFILYIIL